MMLLSRLLGRIFFLRAEFALDGNLQTDLFLWTGNTLVPAACPIAKGGLVAVVICGHGVVTKSDDTEITARVKNDPGTFLWSSSGGFTSFVRRDRLSVVNAELSIRNLRPMRLFCADAAADLESVTNGFAAELLAGLRWRWLLRPTEESSGVVQLLVQRVRLPVLGLFLSLLIANVLLAPRFNTRRQLLQAEVEAREHSVLDAATIGAQQQKLLAQFATPTFSRAMLCDHIAASVPLKVVLTALDVDPLVKRFEGGKPIERRDGVTILCGTAPTASDVSEFMQRLTAATIGCEVRLSGVRREHDNDLLNFQIEIQR